MNVRIDASDFKLKIRELVRDAYIDEKKANNIVQQEFARGRIELAKLIAGRVRIPLNAARRRIRLVRGRRAAKERWKYAALGTYGQSLKVHAGRLKTKFLKAKGKRRKGVQRKRGVIVDGKLIQGSFYYNPKGAKLSGKNRRVYRPGMRSVTVKPNLATVYRQSGPKLIARITDRILKRIMREGMLVRK